MEYKKFNKIDIKDKDDNSSLYLSIMQKNKDAAQSLVYFGADVNLKNNIKKVSTLTLMNQMKLNYDLNWKNRFNIDSTKYQFKK